MRANRIFNTIQTVQAVDNAHLGLADELPQIPTLFDRCKHVLHLFHIVCQRYQIQFQVMQHLQRIIWKPRRELPQPLLQRPVLVAVRIDRCSPGVEAMQLPYDAFLVMACMFHQGLGFLTKAVDSAGD